MSIRRNFSLRDDILIEFRVWLRSVDNYPDIEPFLYHGIKSWLTQGFHPFELYSSVHPGLYRAFSYQILLGWEALLHGFLVTWLVKYQETKYMENNASKTGNRWGKQLITQLWMTIQNYWIHMNLVLHETEAITRLSGVG